MKKEEIKPNFHLNITDLKDIFELLESSDEKFEFIRGKHCPNEY